MSQTFLSGATTPGQSGPWNDGNEGVLCNSQSSSTAGTSPSDCLLSYFRTLVGGVLHLCRGAVSIFHSPSRLGKAWPVHSWFKATLLMFAIINEQTYRKMSKPSFINLKKMPIEFQERNWTFWVNSPVTFLLLVKLKKQLCLY